MNEHTNPPEDAYLFCSACRKKVLLGSAGTASLSDAISEAAAPAANAEVPEKIAPIGRRELRSAVYPVEFRDLARARQLEALRRLEAENRLPGANLVAEAERIADHPGLREWLRRSDRIADPKEMKGRADLVRQRRYGVLRFLEGEDRGFPIHQPVPLHPLPQGRGFWLLRLRDELEWVLMPVFLPTRSRPHPRPTKDRLNHREARAILDWTAFRLDMWLSDRPHLVGGRITIDSSRSVLFDTDVFVRWVYALMN
jgi:hypothetical protein